MKAVNAPRLLPVWAVVRRSFVFSWEHRQTLTIPYTIYAAVTIAINRLAEATALPANGFATYLIEFAELIFGMSFAVGIHRFVLLGDTPHGLAFFRRDRNLVRYALTGVMLLAAMAMLFVVSLSLTAGGQDTAGQPSAAASILGLLSLVAIVAVTIALLRLSLALPAASLGQTSRLALAWQASRGNGPRLFAAAFLVTAPFIAVEALLIRPYLGRISEAIQAGIDTTTVPPPELPVEIALGLISPLLLIVLVVMLSLSYDVLVRGGGPANNARNSAAE